MKVEKVKELMAKCNALGWEWPPASLQRTFLFVHSRTGIGIEQMVDILLAAKKSGGSAKSYLESIDKCGKTTRKIID